MLRVAIAGLALALSSRSLAAAEQGQLDANKTLFSVLAAINAAGYDADADSCYNHPIRKAVRLNLAARNLTTVGELKKYFAAHKQASWTAELSQYISFALSVDDSAEYRIRFKTNEIPPDVRKLEGFDSLMTRFHKEANIDELWKQAQPAYDQAIARYHEGVVRAVLEVNGYLRNPTSGPYLGRRYQIYVDLLGAPHQIQTRSYGDEYFVVVTPSDAPQVDDIRHAYLHYLLDPLAMKYAEPLDKKRGVIDYAQGAPHLDNAYKEDFLLLATECLIKSVEARLAPPAKRDGMVAAALGEGFVLAPYFAEALAGYEKQESAMRLYYPEMVNAINLKKEERRLEKIEFAAQRETRKLPVCEAPKPAKAEESLEEAEKLYESRALDEAKAVFLRVLQETDQRPFHARAYYGLGRIAAQQRDPETAERLFKRTLELSADPMSRAWSHIFLGRLADAAGEREQAVAHYKAVLTVEGVSEQARRTAEKGLQESFRKD